jgi:hypothetical protein
MSLLRSPASAILLALVTSACPIDAQSLGSSLTKLQSSSYEIRKAGFYEVFNLANASTPSNAGFRLRAERTASYARANPAVATALIALLEREVRPDPAKGMLSEDSYFGDLIGCVADLEDPRAVNGLLGAISTGGMAGGGLVALGPVAVPGLLRTLGTDGHEFARQSAADVLGLLVERGTVANDTASIRAGLIGALSDPSMYVRGDVVVALRSFSGTELRTVMQSIASRDTAVRLRSGKREYPVRATAIAWLRRDSSLKKTRPPASSAFKLQANLRRELAPTDLLAAVLSYRFTVVESSTPIDACSVYKLMDTPRDFPYRYPNRVQNLFDRHVNACEPVEPPPVMFDSLHPPTARAMSMIRPDPGWVMIDSVRRVDSLATVYATVRRHGDAVHSEAFKAVFQTSFKSWVITEVRLYGLWYPH